MKNIFKLILANVTFSVVVGLVVYSLKIDNILIGMVFGFVSGISFGMVSSNIWPPFEE